MSLALGVLLSGSGSNFQAILDAVHAGSLDADIKVCLANKADAYGLERAREAGVAAVALPHAEYDSRADHEQAVIAALREHGVEWVALAGYMRMLTPDFLAAFAGRVVNIHPALLPGFPGVHGQRDAAEYGVRFAGCTVHFVDEGMDTGAIIIQAVVPAHVDDDEQSLGARILKCEHRIYPQALQWLAEDRIRLVGRKVVVAGLEKSTPYIDADAPFMIHPTLESDF
jgi:phosphoribosylglycinamide formyltransferase-1